MPDALYVMLGQDGIAFFSHCNLLHGQSSRDRKVFFFIALTGLCEIAGALGLLLFRLRKLAGFALATYAVYVFPANVKHAIDSMRTADPTIWSWIYHCIRLPLQPLLVWGALFAGGIINWPITKKHR